MQKLEINNEDKILIIAPHPDDECIGMGGVLWLYGCQCDVWVISDGAKGKDIHLIEDCSEIRKMEFEQEMAFYNVNSYKMWGLPDGQLTDYEDYLERITFDGYTKLFLINGNDVSVDHRATFRMVMKSLKNKVNSNLEVYQYEVTYPLETISHYIDISKVIDKKKQGIEYHVSQLEIFDYVRTSTALNGYRASMLCEKLDYIEAFFKMDLDVGDLGNNLIDKEIQGTRIRYEIERLLCEILINRSVIEKYFVEREDVYIYGYGVYGKRIEKVLWDEKVKIKAIVDKNKGGKNEYSEKGLEIINIDEVALKNSLVIIAIQDTKMCNLIKDELSSKHIESLTLEEFLLELYILI